VTTPERSPLPPKRTSSSTSCVKSLWTLA
jgi:hypothetical protein